VGRLSARGFTMTWSGTQHGLISIMFAPGEVTAYDAAVRALESGTGLAAAEESHVFTDLFDGEGERHQGADKA
jgi:hypothetical protein